MNDVHIWRTSGCKNLSDDADHKGESCWSGSERVATSPPTVWWAIGARRLRSGYGCHPAVDTGRLHDPCVGCRQHASPNIGTWQDENVWSRRRLYTEQDRSYCGVGLTWPSSRTMLSAALHNTKRSLFALRQVAGFQLRFNSTSIDVEASFGPSFRDACPVHLLPVFTCALISDLTTLS